jgi:4-alpha-glucanotransferase
MTDRWGIDDSYADFEGKPRQIAAETRAALLRAMRVAEGEPRPESPVLVIRQGQRMPVGSSGEIALEDGGRVTFRNATPRTLAAGYHWLETGSARKKLIVAPKRCYLKRGWRAWGWSAQLYSVRSRQSWGIGDLADLQALSRWSGSLGCGVMLLNPLHAALPLLPQNPSPYFPSSRRFRNPLFLSVDETPGAAVAAIGSFRENARALNRRRHIDRDEVYRQKMAALELLWRDFPGDPEFDSFCREQGKSLRRFAIFTALTEHYRKPWREWPAAHRDPASPALEDFARQHSSRVRFHEWLQWLLDRQLASASDGVALMQDLPVGFDPDGIDAWEWQDCLATGVSVGAPPDEYAADGQDWGLPPFIPHKLAGSSYDPFIQTVRSTLRHSGGLRIDHVMGLFRLFWVPVGEKPSRGGYVRYPADDLLAIIALESLRARAFIVGEDLGTVEPEVRKKLAANGVLSYRLAWFEDAPPKRFPRQALAAVSTHDLPTIAGVWSATDPDAGRLRDKLRKLAGFESDASVEDVVVRSHQRLSEAPSVVITASLEDALRVEERPNVPGTVSERPNWAIALPRPLEEIKQDSIVLHVAGALGRSRSGQRNPPGRTRVHGSGFRAGSP